MKPWPEINAFAKTAYEDRTDKAGDLLYNHACRVAVMCNMSLSHMAVALLHDVIEDTDAAYRHVERVLGTDLANRVHILTRSRHDSYMQYIDKVCKDPMCRIVKMGDIADHLDPIRIMNLNESMVRRYHTASERLTRP